MDNSALMPATEKPTITDAGTTGPENRCTKTSNDQSTSMAASTSVSHHDGVSLHDGAVLEQDHPDGDEIRRQVEYYFSDENLPTDAHLLEKCGGRENRPVSVNHITGFKKMRGFKPKKLVVAALRKSTFLEISADGKYITRKIPLQGKCIMDPDFMEENDIAYDPRTQERAQEQIKKLQQSMANPNKNQPKAPKPTGFEKSFVEPVQTPKEAEEEMSLYDEDKPFVERIEIAIQRFKKSRRMHSNYAHIFDTFLGFGGIEYGPRIYQGVTKQEMQNMDAEEIARALATHSVPWDRDDETKWMVDFVGLAKGFLSSWYSAHFGYKEDHVNTTCQVLRSFYNYLRYHSVCPEHDEQLKAALVICDIAEVELHKAYEAATALPGDFNRSASTILGGAHAGYYIGDQAWAQEAKADGTQIDDMGIRTEIARIIFNTGVAVLGSDEQFASVEASNHIIKHDRTLDLEISEIYLPDDLTKAIYTKQLEKVRTKIDILNPLGKLICTPWFRADTDEWDLPRDKYPTGRPEHSNDTKPFEFWVEEDILQTCFVGMKMSARVITLDSGLTILDDIRETMCSFYTWLPNELWAMNKPKEVKWLGKEEESVVEEKKGEGGDGADEKKGDDGEDDEFDDEFDDE